MDIINILHLSDLHFGLELLADIKEDVIEKRTKILDKLIEKIENLDRYWKPDIIVISGDIGFSGEKENYNEAWKWINLLLKKLNLNTERLLLCAGNHDRYIKDIIKLKRIYPKIDDIDKFLEMDNIKILAQRFNAFSEFCKEHYIPYLIFNDESNHLIGFREILKLRFVVLNSSWFSLGDENDRGNIFIGLPHILNMKKKEQLINPDTTEYITISILHHPFEWLNQSEIDKYGERDVTYVELARNCDIILSGHTHGEELFEPDKKFASAWLFKAGAIFDKDLLVYNCEILKIDITNRSADRLKLYYDSEKGWIDEVDKKNPYLFSNGLSRLRLYSKKVLQAIYDKIGKECKIDRSSIITKIEEEISANNIFFITGESMVGKSVIMKDLASKLDSSSEIFAFNVNHFLYNNIEEYFKNLNIIDSFKDILSAVKSVQNRFIFIDQSERILENEKRLSIFKDLLTVVFSYNKEMIDKGILQDNCWKIILCCRSEKYKNVRYELDRLCSDLDIQIKNKKVKPLEKEELNQVCDFFPKLALLINKPNLNKLITLPKILDILTMENFKLTEEDIIEGYNHNCYTETYLMKQFWEKIIRNNESVSDNGIRPEARDQLLQKISLHYFTSNEPYKITEEDEEVLFSDLISKQILLREGEQLKFSHDVFEDWALLRHMMMKSDIINDFLRPFNNSRRNSRAFQLFSRKLLEIDENIEKWRLIFNSLEQQSDLNLKWKQDFIFGVLKSEILSELLIKLKSKLLEENGVLLNYVLKILKTKCIIYEKNLKPNTIEWLIVITFLKNIFSELEEKTLFKFSEIVSLSIGYYIYIPDLINSLIELFIDFIKTRILNSEYSFSLDYEDKNNLKKNIIFTILWGVCYKSDELITVLNEIRALKRNLFQEVILNKNGWRILFNFAPEYALDVLKDFLIKTKEIPEYILSSFNRMEWEHSFVNSSLFNEDSFKFILDTNNKIGLDLIHEIVNHATWLWCNMDEPVYCEPLQMISRQRTPIPQKIQYEENEIIVWGDHFVYRWNIPMGFRPNLVTCALIALENWMIKQIKDEGKNPLTLIQEILNDTKSISIVLVCINTILCNYFSPENKNKTELLNDLIKSIIPFMENPVFWDLDLKRSAEVEMISGTRDYHRYTIDWIFPFILFQHDKIDKTRLFTKMEDFPNKIPFYFEEEKTCENLIRDRVRQFTYVAARTKKENWRLAEIAPDFTMPILYLPPEIVDQEDDEKLNAFFDFVSMRSWVQTFLNKGEFLDYYNLDTVLEKIDFLIDLDKKIDKPIAFHYTGNNAELIAAFYGALVIHKWDYVIEKKLEKKCKVVLLKAVDRIEPIGGYSEAPYSRNSFGYKRSAARSLPILYKNCSKHKKLKKAIIYLAEYYNHEVRDILFSNLIPLWKSNSKLIWKCLEKVKKLSILTTIVNSSEKKKQKIKKRKISKTQNKSLDKLSPEEIALNYYRSALNVIPIDDSIKELESNEKFIEYLKELFNFTFINDINYKNTNTPPYPTNNSEHFFYFEWAPPVLKAIANATLHFDKKYTIFFNPILSDWKKMDKFLIIFLENLIILSDQPNTETRFIKIWYKISNLIFESIQNGDVVRKELVNLIFFQDHFGFILKKKFDDENSIIKIESIIDNFLNNTDFYLPIIQFLNEIKNPFLIRTSVKNLSKRLRSFSYSEDQHFRLKENLYNLLNNHWSQNKSDIEGDDEYFQLFKSLINILVEWGSILAGKLQEELNSTNN
ncbi:MAG: metallophosphoesterase [Candidatus Helarchaeota archaeon]